MKTSDGRNAALYKAYKELAAADPRVTFIGRCGTYQYLDMHQVNDHRSLARGLGLTPPLGEVRPDCISRLDPSSDGIAPCASAPNARQQ